MTQNNTAIVLSHHVHPDGSLSTETRRRVDKGIEHYVKNDADTLTVSGGYATKDVPFAHANCMAEYAIVSGIPAKSIYRESQSLDTVGQVIFLKDDIIVPNNWNRFIVVTSDYHITRAMLIFNFVFGRDFDIQYSPVPTLGEISDTVRAKEASSVSTFLRTFEGVRAGDTAALVERLFSAHPLYKKK